MKKIALLIPALFIISGCKSNDISRAVQDGINGAVNGVTNSTTRTITSNNQSTYSTSQERVALTEAKKTSRDYGQISLAETAANPNKHTRLAINECLHPRVGMVGCTVYLYEISPEGWIIDPKSNQIWLETRNNSKDKVVPAGTYYFKVKSKGMANDSYVTGTYTIQPFVTNKLNFTFE